MHGLIAEVKLLFSNKFVAIGIMKTLLLFGIQLYDWRYFNYLRKSTFF